MVIDYSKWDKLNVSSSSESEDIEEIDTLPDGSVVLEPQTAVKKSTKPTITKFSKPQKVHIGTQPGRSNILSSSCDVQATPKHCPPSVSSQEITRVSSLRVAQAGAILPNNYAWEQTAFSVTYWIHVPLSADMIGRKNERQVSFIKEKPAKEKFGDYDIPYAFAASSFQGADLGAEDEDKLFPIAWGVKVRWPVCEEAHCPDSWTVIGLVAEREFLFPYPVSCTEEAWGWQLTSGCPIMETSRKLINLEVTKKASGMLGGVSIWWDRAFLGEPKINLKRSEDQTQFQKNWQEAHRMFKEKMKDHRKIEIASPDV